MKFERYPSIENSYRESTLSLITTNPCKYDEWEVREKIHGANGSLTAWLSDTGSPVFRWGKRSSYLDDDINFHNHKKFAYFIEAGVKRLIYTEGLKNIVVYGEYYGGYYPHPDILRLSTCSKVQAGVWYCDYNTFRAFDIKIEGSFISGREFDSLCDMYGIPYIPVLFRGSLAECLAFDVEFVTTIPKLHGLPELENNITEGIVIKPNKPTYIGNTRIILKKKSNQFSEVQHRSYKLRMNKQDASTVSSECEDLISKLPAYINTARLSCVLSKLQEVKQTDFGILLKEMNKDVLEDFNKDYGLIEDKLHKEEGKLFNKTLNKLNADFIRPHFLNIVDGTFTPIGG